MLERVNGKEKGGKENKRRDEKRKVRTGQENVGFKHVRNILNRLEGSSFESSVVLLHKYCIQHKVSYILSAEGLQIKPDICLSSTNGGMNSLTSSSITRIQKKDNTLTELSPKHIILCRVNLEQTSSHTQKQQQILAFFGEDPSCKV